MPSGLTLVLLMFVVGAVPSGVGTHLLTRRELAPGNAASVSVACGMSVGITCVCIPYLPLLAFFVAAAAYLVMRRVVRVGPVLALAGSGALLLVSLGGCVLLLAMALENM